MPAFSAQRASAVICILDWFQHTCARIVTLAATKGTSVLPTLLLCVEIDWFLPDVLAPGEAFKRLVDLLRRVEGLGFFPDFLAPGKTLKRLGGLLGRVCRG